MGLNLRQYIQTETVNTLTTFDFRGNDLESPETSKIKAPKSAFLEVIMVNPSLMATVGRKSCQIRRITSFNLAKIPLSWLKEY